MNIYYAPMEGITDAIYRKMHARYFGGIQKYFIPFISPTQDRRLPPREMRAISPDVNQGLYAIPQVLTRDPVLFIWIAERLAEMGYPEVNLNLGCPSGTVTAKGKGAGMLQDPDALKTFFDAIYAHSPLPVSVKTRIGFYSEEEWESIFSVFQDYPIHELIVHPRTRQEFYKGDIHMDIYLNIASAFNCPVVFNGNLFSMKEIEALKLNRVRADALMIGRGLASNPALAREANGGPALRVSELQTFHDALFRAYSEMYPERIVLGKMREVSKYLACCFSEARKPLKRIFKAQHTDDYLEAVDMLLHLDMLSFPGYTMDQPSQTWP